MAQCLARKAVPEELAYYEHEMRALVELGQTGVRWRYLGHVPARYAASVILTEVPSSG